MKAIFLAAALLLSGCGLQKAIKSAGDTSDQIGDMQKEMKKTNGTIQDQCVQISFDEMLKPENGKDLSPVPFDIMPFAKKFGECVSADDFTEVMYLWMKKMNELTIDQGLPMPPPTDEQKLAFDLHKMQVYSALASSAGFLPEDKLQQIIHDQIDNEGRFQETALQILMLRTRFLRDVMLNASLFKTPLNNVGMVQKAIEYADQIDEIARLPYAKAIKVKITGFQLMPPIEESFDTGLALTEWNTIRTKAAHCFGDETMPDNCNSPGVHEKASPQTKAKLSQSLKYVDQKILSWGGTLDPL